MVYINIKNIRDITRLAGEILLKIKSGLKTSQNFNVNQQIDDNNYEDYSIKLSRMIRESTQDRDRLFLLVLDNAEEMIEH